MTALLHDLDAARATEAVAEKQRQEHANMAADAFGDFFLAAAMMFQRTSKYNIHVVAVAHSSLGHSHSAAM